MVFTETKSIYEQIAEHIVERIAAGSLQPEDRIPSVRELALDMGVNPNTVQRSYGRLQEQGFIYNQRGVGYFVAADAPKAVRAYLSDGFEQDALPQMFRIMQRIDYPIERVVERWNTFRSTEEAR